MSTSEILYVKGMNMSESDEDDNGTSAWDDRKLTDAYDKALKIANAEVAKRVAMSTNTQNPVNKEENSKTKKDKSSIKPSCLKKKDIQWKSGMPCRSVYEGDGLEYEAFVLRIINDKECVIRYLGYENSEIVLISSLKPTHGNEERTRQIEQALLEKCDEGFGTQSPHLGEMDASDRAASPDLVFTDRPSCHKKKRTSKKKNCRNNFELPEMPMTMPNISLLKNLGSMEMPMPPPPMAFTGDRTDSEDQAISSMLLSWYMSGYYTGLYQGLKRAKETRRNT